MTSAEFKTLRESLGLTTQWIADRADVKLRTAQYWEAGRMAVPADVAAMLQEIDDTLEVHVVRAVDELKSFTSVTLLRFRTNDELWKFKPQMNDIPVTTHAALLARVRRALRSRGVNCVIEFMNLDEYLAWLTDRPDTEAARVAWASAILMKGIK